MPPPVDQVGVQARLQPDRLAVHDLAQERRWTYAQFDRAIGGAARVQVEQGLAPGERIAALARNRAELIILHLACARIGAIYVPLNWRLSLAELAALIEDCEPRLLVGDEELERAGLVTGRPDARVECNQGRDRALREQVGCDICELSAVEENPDAGIAKLECEFPRRQASIERHHRTTGPGDAVPSLEKDV